MFDIPGDSKLISVNTNVLFYVSAIWLPPKILPICMVEKKKISWETSASTSVPSEIESQYMLITEDILDKKHKDIFSAQFTEQ